MDVREHDGSAYKKAPHGLTCMVHQGRRENQRPTTDLGRCAGMGIHTMRHVSSPPYLFACPTSLSWCCMIMFMFTL